MEEQYQEQHTIEESTINNTISEEEPVNTIETKELTLSEHCKELIFDNFEPRPGLPRLNHGSSSQPQTKALLPAYIIKKKDAK